MSKINKECFIEKLLSKIGVEIFNGRNGKAVAIDTKKYRYWITGWKIEKIPQHQICDKFSWEISDVQKSIFNSEIKIFKFKRFWKGFVYYPFDVKSEIYKLTNRIESLEEDIDCVHIWLDNMLIPRCDTNTFDTYSIIGRIKLYLERQPITTL